MSEYIIPIKIAVITFPIFAALFTLPFLIYQYRKHGYINYYRAFLLYLFLLYLITAYYLIILPLPKTRDVLSLQKPGTKHIQLVPLKFVVDILSETKVQLIKPSTYFHLFKERAFLQAVFNGVLLLPLGIYLSYYFKNNIKKTILISFCVSLFFELTQLSGLYGFYNAPYRIFDVDDLMLNTLGGYLGYMIAPVFMKLLPNVSKLDENVKLEHITVGFVRRFLAFAFDWCIFIILSIITRGYLKIYIFVFLYFILITYFTNGKTFGKWILRIKVTGRDEKLKFKEVLIRYGVLYYVFFGGNYIIFSKNALSHSIGGGYFNYILMILVFLLNLAVIRNITVHFFSKDKKLFHDKISSTRLTVTN
ncbi:VanZ family protein [Clostridium sp. 001]|uniref:VanZ family protein n=1 Tax=Clostridium sp. 001 TaxID=1970093 RepID=UPI001C2CBC69|nr:VanZ family protein [Clostridium sp. 001]QXE18587.1 permease [Clostridium sp. 001]